MNSLNNHSFDGISNEQLEQAEAALPRAEAKKPFVEPVVSVPIDVLEATSFFQNFSSGDSGDV